MINLVKKNSFSRTPCLSQKPFLGCVFNEHFKHHWLYVFTSSLPRALFEKQSPRLAPSSRPEKQTETSDWCFISWQCCHSASRWLQDICTGVVCRYSSTFPHVAVSGYDVGNDGCSARRRPCITVLHHVTLPYFPGRPQEATFPSSDWTITVWRYY